MNLTVFVVLARNYETCYVLAAYASADAAEARVQDELDADEASGNPQFDYEVEAVEVFQ